MEIKFKAWSKLDKKMYPVRSITFNDEHEVERILVLKEENGIIYLHEILAPFFILLPCTGMHDSEGNDIYKGDIVQIPYDWDEYGMYCGEIYEVYFAFGGFRLKPKYTRGKGFYVEEEKVLIHLGNIYENPELLEEE